MQSASGKKLLLLLRRLTIQNRVPVWESPKLLNGREITNHMDQCVLVRRNRCLPFSRTYFNNQPRKLGQRQLLIQRRLAVEQCEVIPDAFMGWMFLIMSES